MPAATANIASFKYLVLAAFARGSRSQSTFIPPLNPSFTYAEPLDFQVDVVRSQKGYPISRPLGVRGVRSIQLRWAALNEDQKDTIVSFFQSLNGQVGPFSWTPLDKVPSPLGATPALSQVSGGALSQRTYFVVFSWYHTSSLETKASARQSITVDASFFLKVEVPVLPTGVEAFRVYAHETSGSEVLQSTVTGSRSWTQSVALATGTATPPTTNTLAAPATWMLTGPVIPTRIRPNRWRLELSFQELFT